MNRNLLVVSVAIALLIIVAYATKGTAGDLGSLPSPTSASEWQGTDEEFDDAVLEAATAYLLENLSLSQRSLIIYGTVRNEAGEAIPGAILGIENVHTGSRKTASVRTNENGQFMLIEYHAWGERNLIVTADGYSRAAAHLGLRQPYEHTVERVRHDFVLEPGMPIAGEVVDSESGRGLEGVHLRLESKTDDSIAFNEVTDRLGHFRFEVSAGAEYELVAQSKSHDPIDPMPVKAGDEIVLKANAATASISGRVVNARSKEGLNALTINARGDNLWFIRFTSSTEEDGTFRIENVPAGIYIVSVSTTDRSRVESAEPLTVEVKPGEESSGHTFDFASTRRSTITARHYQSREPLAGVVFEVLENGEIPSGRRYETDDQGQITFESPKGHPVPSLALANADYVGYLESDGNFAKSPGLIIDLASASMATETWWKDVFATDVTLYPMKTVEVQVRDYVGEPIPDAAVFFASFYRSIPDSDSPFLGITNSEGIARLSVVPIDSPYVVARRDGYLSSWSAWIRFDENGEPQNASLSLLELESIRVTGIVVDERDNPIVGAKIFHSNTRLENDPELLAVSSEAGRFEYNHAYNPNIANQIFAHIDQQSVPIHSAVLVGEREAEVRLVIDTRQSYIAGRVLDHDGEPISGVQIKVQPSKAPAPQWFSFSGRAETTTNEFGRFRFPSLVPGGEFYLRVIRRTSPLESRGIVLREIHSQLVYEDLENLIIQVPSPSESNSYEPEP